MIFSSCSEVYTVKIFENKSVINKSIKNSKDDATLVIQNAITKSDTVYIKQGVYPVYSLFIPSNKVIKTDGYKTQLIQNKVPHSTNVLNIIGSNILIDSIKITGSISEDEFEFNHAINISSTNNSIHNIVIRGLMASNIRGDAVYIGTTNTLYFPENISISNIRAFNCYRNGISITAGKKITLENIQVEKIGLLGIDLEPYLKGVVIDSVKIKNAHVSSIGILGENGNVSNITIDDVFINGLLKGSTPNYDSSKIINDGLVIRNAHDLVFNRISILNNKEFAIRFIREVGDYNNNKIQFNDVHLANNALSSNPYNSYILIKGVSNLIFDDLKASLPNNRSLFLGSDNPLEIPYLKVIVNKSEMKGGIFARYIQLEANLLNLINSSTAFDQLLQNSTIRNSNILANILNNNGNSTLFINCHFIKK